MHMLPSELARAAGYENGIEYKLVFSDYLQLKAERILL